VAGVRCVSARDIDIDGPGVSEWQCLVARLSECATKEVLMAIALVRLVAVKQTKMIMAGGSGVGGGDRLDKTGGRFGWEGLMSISAQCLWQIHR
jgi:hypothetical protein